MIQLLNAGVAALILLLAAFAVLTRRLFAAAAAFVAYGLLLTLAWVQLGGLDVALVEAAIGGGLTGALVIGSAARLRRAESTTAGGERAAAPARMTAALVAGAVAAAIAACVLALPDPAPSLAPQVAANIAVTGLGNAITAVLLVFRAMDTLLEAIVLLFALIGVWSLAPDQAWGGRPGSRYGGNPDDILAYAARLLAPIGVVVGIYIFWVGADHPGGKFQGATILAAMGLLLARAGLTDAPPISRTWLRIALVGGPAAFIAIGFLGAGWAGAFLAYPEGYAKPLILAIEWALLPSLALTLFLLLAGAPQRVAAA
ncbi:MAG TPA: MnhB domain-containing protein [Xanthobacteraceae bacterium]|jgi:multisubunit Na+/H+ antiporter MnhB subunit